MNVDPSQVARVDTRLFYQAPEERESVSLWRQMAAAYNLDMPEINAWRMAGDIASEPEPEADFDLIANLTPEEALHAEEYSHADSRAELALIRQRRQHEGEWERALGEGPLPALLASSLAILGSPSTWVPFLGGVAGAGRAANLGARMARIGALAGAEVAASEVVLQAAQETRDWHTSVAAIMMGGAFGAGLGAAGAGRALSRQADDAYQAATEDFATVLRHEDAEARGTSIGAARVQTLAPEDTELASSFGYAEAMARVPRVLQAPALALMNSKSPIVREAALRLVDIGMLTKGVLRNVEMPQAVDISIRSYANENMFALTRGVRMSHKAHKKAGGKLSRREFGDEVGRAMRRDSRHADPVVSRAATEIRKIFDTLSTEAKRLIPDFKTIPEKDGWRYLTRVYRRDKIMADMIAWKGVVTRHFMNTKQAVDWGDAQEMADAVTDRIIGAPADRPDLVMAPASLRGPTKERVFDIPDHLIEPWLESNIEAVAGRYIRSITADLQFARTFKDTGNPMDPIADWAPKIRDEANKAAEAAAPGQREAIIKKADADTELLRDLINRVRGVSPPPSVGGETGREVLKIARDLNMTRALGSVTVSALPDLARLSMQEGTARVWGSFLVDMASGFRAMRMGIRQAQSIGDAVDLELNNTAMARFDVDATREGQTWIDKTSRATGRMASVFMKSTLMPQWNTFWKGVGFTVASTRILRTAERFAAGKPLSKFDQLRAKQSGLSDADFLAIAKEAPNWSKAGSNRLPNLETWSNQAVARKVRLALMRDVDDAILTPGVGDAPLWTGTDLGKAVFQFKRYGMAANHRILLAGLQRRDAATMAAFAQFVGLGGMAYLLKEIVNKGELPEYNPRELAVNAVDRSGLLSLFMELDGLSQASFGMSPMQAAAGRKVSRFATRGPISQLAGPTAGFFEDAAKAADGLISGEFTRPDLHKLRRLAPWQNYFMFSAGLNKLEEATGLPERSR